MHTLEGDLVARRLKEVLSMKARVLALLSVLFAIPLLATPVAATSEGHTYLALGDSVPFGFSPLLDASNAANFIGYPEVVAQRLNIEDANATCPGEATGGFLSLTGTDNVCRPYRSAFPLHAGYSGSQIDFATSYLQSHRNTRLVTLMLGANDLFRFQKDCALVPPAGTCLLGFNGMLAVMRANLTTILGDIRATGYKGLIVAVTYYALNYADPTSVAGAQALDAQMAAAASANGAIVASGFEAWMPAATAAGGDSCAAGLLIALPGGGCDVHPSPAGRDLLADAVMNTIGGSCPAASAIGCLDRNRG